MMIGATSATVDATIVATKAAARLACWSAITGASRLSAPTTEALCWPAGASLSLYGFVVAGASLRVIDLHVLGRRFHQVLMGA